MKSKFYIVLLLSILSVQPVLSQGQVTRLSLSEAYDLLEKRYPALRDDFVVKAIHKKEQQKLNKSRLPGIYLKGDARLQSESPTLDLPEGSTLPFQVDLPLYYAKTYVEAQFTVLDGGLIKAQKHVSELEFKADLQNVEVSRYALRERINLLFVNIAMLRLQTNLYNISMDDLGARKEIVAAGVDEGVVLESELNQIRVKELELQAQKDDVLYRLKGQLEALSELIGLPLLNNVFLEFPAFDNPGQIPALDRPEQELFKLQQAHIIANAGLINASRRPMLSAFAQGGVGYPNPFNFLDNGGSTYGVMGLQFNWKITDWNKSKLDKEILTLRAQQVQNAKATFEFNQEVREATYLAEVNRLQDQLKKDVEIAALQSSILDELGFRLNEGLITSADYIIQVNAELKARQMALIHEMELLSKEIEFWNDRGGK